MARFHLLDIIAENKKFQGYLIIVICFQKLIALLSPDSILAFSNIQSRPCFHIVFLGLFWARSWFPRGLIISDS